MSQPLSAAPVAQFDPMLFLTGGLPSAMASIAQQSGPLFRYVMRYGPDAQREIVFLVGPEANKLVFNTERESFSHERGWTPIIGDTMGKGLLNMDAAEWARHRKMWNPAFTQSYMESYLPLIWRVIAAQTATWAERGEVDIYQESRDITFAVAATALAGIAPSEEVQRLRALFYLLIPHQMMASEAAYEEYERKARQAKAELDTTLLRLIAERRAAPASAAPHDVLGMIVHARDDQGMGLTDEEVLGHLYILLVAGHETTTTLGAWALYYLATLPEQRARVEAELSALLEDDTSPLTVQAARGLKVLENFIKETGRLHAPVLNVPRGVVRDVAFAGYTIPAGTQVRLALSACHRLPTVFARPEAFDPDRFAPPREEERRTPYGLVTFGGGPRLCIGVNFANIEVKALVAHVLRTYTLEATMDQPPLDLGFITTIIPTGMPMRVTPRR
ncbi:MAG: cytochrome P450 [Ktedonobacterales bacterium]|nr:cytochrome P450 [Ktedonobacterales bacterium]